MCDSTCTERDGTLGQIVDGRKSSQDNLAHVIQTDHFEAVTAFFMMFLDIQCRISFLAD